jgi:hypothetical protein
MAQALVISQAEPMEVQVAQVVEVNIMGQVARAIHLHLLHRQIKIQHKETLVEEVRLQPLIMALVVVEAPDLRELQLMELAEAELRPMVETEALGQRQP